MLKGLFEETGKAPGLFWKNSGPLSDVVLSTRTRIIRNFRSFPFPGRMNPAEAESLFKLLTEVSLRLDDSVIIRLSDITDIEKRLLRERNLITSEMESNSNASVLIGRYSDYSVLLNETDHFKIQAILPGLQVDESIETALRIEKVFGEIAPFAFSKSLGYLTSSPYNLGTGIKCSIIVHLPSVALSKSVHELQMKIMDSGVSIVETSGPGSRAVGSLFYLYTGHGLGKSEEDILNSIQSASGTVLNFEDRLRDEYVAANRLELEDRIWRSFAALSYARKISYAEAMDHLSNLRLGIVLSTIKGISIHDVTDIMVTSQQAHLTLLGGVMDSSAGYDERRAGYIRNKLKEIRS